MTKEEIIINELYPIELILQVKSKSSNVKCPLPSHTDSRPSAHIYDNKVYCFTCSRFFDVLTIARFNGIDLSMLKKYVINHYTKDEIISVIEGIEGIEDQKVEQKVVKQVNDDFINFTSKYFLKK